MEKIIVLMSSYNGEEFITEQIDSILSQDVNLNLVVRDDGSTDNTLRILDTYAKKHNNFTYFKGKNLKPARSFLNLIKNAGDADYYALSDQDDYWDKDKVSTAIAMLKNEDDSLPLLYFSNLRVVDKDLKFCRDANKAEVNTSNKKVALTEAVAAGCTMVFNRSLKELLCKKMPDKVSMHDAWIYLVAIYLGKVIYDRTPHISYRQHGTNVIGLSQGSNLNIEGIRRAFDTSEQPRYLNACQLINNYGSMISLKDLPALLKVVNYKKSIRNKLLLFFDFSIHASTLLRNIKFRIRILIGTI